MREFDFESHTGKALHRSLLVLLVALAALLWDPRHPVLLGFVIGTAVSVVNGFFLARGIKTMVGVLLRHRAVDKAAVFFLLGVPVRWLIIFGVVFLAASTGWFSLPACLGGFFVLPAFAVAGMVRVLAAQGYKTSSSS
ncbi:MAG: ATP synthase subunit I [Bacillota bacterium]